MSPTTSDALRRVIDRDSADPHAYLGAHPSTGGVVLRTFRPDATKVVARVDGGTEVELHAIHPDGVFEGEVRGASLPLRYEYEVAYAAGTFTLRDPYAFPPTLGDVDIYLAGEGRHQELYERLGAHVRDVDGVTGTSFAVWAPSARSISVIGAFNSWDGRLHPMRSLGSSGIWELFVPGVAEGEAYKFEIRTQSGQLLQKADPFAFAAEVPPQTNSVVHRSQHEWSDDAWLELRRDAGGSLNQPVSIYEVHLGSWRRDPGNPDRELDYDQLADELADYCSDMGFTHVELLPVMAHPFSGSWGYQVTSYYAPTPRHGDADGFKRFVDRMHEAGIGVILDWVPAHFPRDDWALARFDGTALYEHEDPRQGAHPDWGTLVFNFGRNEVRNFLVANALWWLREYHADGLRVDAVASMLYLDYSRKEGEWVPNEFGGRENIEAVEFLKEFNAVVYGRNPGAMTIAEESTAWPMVSRPVSMGGLGFGYKWNMGWMHDTLQYMSEEPIHRSYHHDELTFSLVYAFNENFVLPLSHDEVVHGKGSLISKMPGDEWQKFANLRLYYAFMYGHPGKQLLFMGGEIAQWSEWNHDAALDWRLLENPMNAGVQAALRDLNALYTGTPALYEVDFEPTGFEWIEGGDRQQSVVSFLRCGRGGDDHAIVVCNFTPVVRHGYRVGVPERGAYKEAFNTDATHYGGSGVTNGGEITAENIAASGREYSLSLTLPPLAAVVLKPIG